TRLDHTGEIGPIAVQIAGAEPAMMAEAARMNVILGAQIIDINMGCPAKKVCKRAAGSALLQDEKLVAEILQAVVGAVEVPVTLKIRTGWSPDQRNALNIARIAEDSGIAALAVHGRTRACRFNGEAEYDTIAQVVTQSRIPVLCNGDIDSPQKAELVLQKTGAAAVMIGRAAQGRPWIFREIEHYLATGEQLPDISLNEIKDILCTHLRELTALYGPVMGPRIARKHLGWYLQTIPGSEMFRRHFNQLHHAQDQYDSVLNYFEQLQENEEIAA
ncbi:MAG TPA: tRNA dihydrouridine synthase DusB, partial [Cellvibrionaceae bacterium]